MISILKKLSTVAPAFALLISIAVLVVSYYSYQQSAEELKLKKSDAKIQKLATWIGVIDEDNQELYLSSANKEFYLQSADLIFDSCCYHIFDDDLYSYSMNYDESISLLFAKNGIANLFRQYMNDNPGKFKKNSNKRVTGTGKIKLHVLIEAKYIAKGELLFDRSIYLLQGFFKIDSDKIEEPSIIFSSLNFVKRLSLDEEFTEILRNWSNKEQLEYGINEYMPKPNVGFYYRYTVTDGYTVTEG